MVALPELVGSCYGEIEIEINERARRRFFENLLKVNGKEFSWRFIDFRGGLSAASVLTPHEDWEASSPLHNFFQTRQPTSNHQKPKSFSSEIETQKTPLVQAMNKLSRMPRNEAKGEGGEGNIKSILMIW